MKIMKLLLITIELFKEINTKIIFPSIFFVVIRPKRSQSFPKKNINELLKILHFN